MTHVRMPATARNSRRSARRATGAFAAAGMTTMALIAVAPASPAAPQPGTISAPIAATAPAAGSTTKSTSSDRETARVAAGWLSRRFVDGTHLTTTYDGTAYDDAGLTLDAVLAFAAAKTNDVTAARAMTWLAEPARLAGYLGDGTQESYAGAHAKLVLTLKVRGLDPSSYGGRDPLAELAGLQRADGRLSDRSQWGDYSNGFGQSLGAIALDRAGRSAAGRKAADYLAGQACADGSVPVVLEQSTCVGDRDATAMALQAFTATGRGAAAQKAAKWLATQVRTKGHVNANSAGLAAAGLDQVRGYGAVADAARAYLRSLQVPCSASFDRRGAIKYTPGPYDESLAVRATTQAALGLTGADLETLVSRGSIAYAPAAGCR